MTFYGIAQMIVRAATRMLAPDIAVEGLDNLPATGPALVFANHQSFIDPPVIQAFAPRPMYTMAKSSQFSAPVLGWLMIHLHAFPVRRFEPDPTAVRTVLRLLDKGAIVCIYPEGERSWDGRLQPPRLGAIRLALRAGVPVIPCAIHGSYDILPRWSHAVRRARIRIRYGSPLHIGPIHDRRTRERQLPDAARSVMNAIADLLEQPPPSLDPLSALGHDAPDSRP